MIAGLDWIKGTVCVETKELCATTSSKSGKGSKSSKSTKCSKSDKSSKPPTHSICKEEPWKLRDGGVCSRGCVYQSLELDEFETLEACLELSTTGTSTDR